MSLRINDTIPNLEVETDEGKTSLHEFVGESWTILFSHPKDFTPVCATSHDEADAISTTHHARRWANVRDAAVQGAPPVPHSPSI